MSDIKTKLYKLTADIGTEAAAEAMEIIKDLKSRRKLSVLEAEEKIAAESARHTAERISEIRLREIRRVSARTMENKRKVLSLREECLKDISGEVLRMITVFTQSADYGPHLEAMLDEAVSASGGGTSEAVLYLRNEDLHFAPRLSGRAPGLAPTVREGAFTLGGLVLELPAESISVDMSFDTAFQDLPGLFIEISHIGGRD